MRQRTSKGASEVIFSQLFIHCQAFSLSLRWAVYFRSENPLEKTDFHGQVVINWRQFLGQGWGHVSTSPFSFRTPSGAGPCRPCVCFLSFYEFTRVLTLLIYIQCFVFFMSSIPCGRPFTVLPLLQGSLSPEGRTLMGTSLCGLLHSLLLSVQCLAVSVCLFPFAAGGRSLMMAKHGMNL